MKPSRLNRPARFGAGVLLFIVIITLAFALIQASSGPVTVVQAAPLQQVHTVSFSSPNYNANEGAGTVTIDVIISPNLTQPDTASVEYLTVDGTAQAGRDYVAASGTLNFDSASNTQSFTIQIVDDNLPEPGETINLVLRNPVDAELGTSTATVTIIDNDPTPTPTATGGPPILVDQYEPNDSFEDATDIASDAPALCNLTLWPVGDQDFFRFVGKANSAYEILTSGLSPGLDTEITLYNTRLNEIASNDDYQIGSRASRVTTRADVDGFYYIRVINNDPSDPANKRYCLEINEVAPPTPPPAFPPGADACEFNSTFETACVIGEGQTLNLTFVPTLGSEQDTDKFRLWIKPGIFYTCETLNLSPVTDTNMILYDGNTNPFNPWIGNDDKAPGDFGSRVTYLSTYTGWLYVEVGPVNPPESLEVAAQHTYDLTCTGIVATPTPTATPTVLPPAGGGGFPVATAVPTGTPEPTATPFDISIFFTPTPAPPPVIQIQPLPTATAFAAGQEVTINVTLYYDSNLNFMPELTEGIADVAIALYDNATGQLLAYGQTNEAGMIRFSSINTSGAVRVVVPFLGYSQTVPGGSTDILLRVAPQPLPIGIP